MKKQKFTTAILSLALALNLFTPLFETQAFTPEIPYTLIYEGRLLSKTSTPLSGNYIMRFSLWNTTDIITEEINPNGTLNTSAIEYGDWTEELPVTFTNQGYFSLILGQQTPLTDIALSKHKYLQVEIKLVSSPDTDYQVLDVDFSNDAIDRKHIASLPYAFNSNESVNSQNAEHALIADAADGSTGNIFIIDPQNITETTGTGLIGLQFGTTLAKY